MAEIKDATDDTFEALVLNNDKPVVVDFWAAWCGPCKMVAPEMEKLAAKYDGVVDVVKVDVDANPRLSQAFGIMSIPTIAYFKPGAAAAGRRGLPPARAARAGVPAHRPRGAEARLTRHRPRAGPLFVSTTPVPDRGRVMLRVRAGRDRAVTPVSDPRRGGGRTGPRPRRGPARTGRRRGVNAIQPAPAGEAAVSGVLSAALATAGSSATSSRSASASRTRRPATT